MGLFIKKFYKPRTNPLWDSLQENLFSKTDSLITFKSEDWNIKQMKVEYVPNTKEYRFFPISKNDTNMFIKAITSTDKSIILNELKNEMKLNGFISEDENKESWIPETEEIKDEIIWNELFESNKLEDKKEIPVKINIETEKEQENLQPYSFEYNEEKQEEKVSLNYDLIKTYKTQNKPFYKSFVDLSFLKMNNNKFVEFIKLETFKQEIQNKSSNEYKLTYKYKDTIYIVNIVWLDWFWTYNFKTMIFFWKDRNPFEFWYAFWNDIREINIKTFLSALQNSLKKHNIPCIFANDFIQN